MKKIRLYFPSAVFIFSSPIAFASSPGGLLTLIVGIPLLAVATVVLTIMILVRSSKILKVVSVTLFVPVLLYSLYIALDAVTLFGTLGSENSMIGIAFFSLLSMTCFLFYLVITKSVK